MAHPTLPFLKDKKVFNPPVLALPAPKDLTVPLRLPYRPNSIIKRPQPIDITVKWQLSPVQLILKEYQSIFPHARIPTEKDLLIWAYNRAKNAESTIEMLNQEIRILQSGQGGV